MYVCLCKAITESQISAAVDEGADSLVKLRKKIGVADSCGSCIETAESIISHLKRIKTFVINFQFCFQMIA